MQMKDGELCMLLTTQSCHRVFSIYFKTILRQCRRQSIQSRGAKSKSRGPKFLLILDLKKHAVHNVITSINNSLQVQSEIILIGVTSSESPFPEHFCHYFE